MSVDGPDRPPSHQPRQRTIDAATRTAVVGGAVVVVLSIGWFFLSHLAMGTDTADAVGEALGVLLGLLIVVSVVGAVASSRENRGRST